MNKKEKKGILKFSRKYFSGAGQILDIACGKGQIAEILLRDGYQVIGCDPSEQMLDEAKVNLQHFGNLVTLEKHENLEKLPYSSDFFDGVVCSSFWNHFVLDIQLLAIKELLRVSKTGVVLVCPKKNFALWGNIFPPQEPEARNFPVNQGKLRKAFQENDITLRETIGSFVSSKSIFYIE